MANRSVPFRGNGKIAEEIGLDDEVTALQTTRPYSCGVISTGPLLLLWQRSRHRKPPSCSHASTIIEARRAVVRCACHSRHSAKVCGQIQLPHEPA